MVKIFFIFKRSAHAGNNYTAGFRLSPDIFYERFLPVRIFSDNGRIFNYRNSSFGAVGVTSAACYAFRMVCKNLVSAETVSSPSAIFGYSGGMVAMNDRIKLRPLVAASNGDFTYVASEEAAIRAVCQFPDMIWSPKAGEPVMVEFDDIKEKTSLKGGLLSL